jgi:hypothetical protein
MQCDDSREFAQNKEGLRVKQYEQFSTGAGAVQVGCIHGNVIIFQCPHGATCPRRPQFKIEGGLVMKMLCVIAIVAALTGAPAWAINKCTGPDGKVSFQDAPCQSGKAETLDVRPSSGRAPAAAGAIARPASAPLATAPVAGPAPVQAPAAATAEKSPLEKEADTCLAWYKPMLRDPAGAYYSAPSKEGRVVSMTVHATNGYGGYVTKAAACEIVNGRIDEDWTKIQAQRRAGRRKLIRERTVCRRPRYKQLTET